MSLGIAAVTLLRVHQAVAATRAAGESCASPVPTSHDVCAAAHRAGLVGDRDDILELCAALGLRLADHEARP